MKVSEENKVLSKGNLKVEFKQTGDLYSIFADTIQINQVLSNNVEESLTNLYLRMFKDNQIISTPLLGIDSPSLFYTGEDQVKWLGTFAEVDYEVIFSLGANETWFWEVNLKGNGQKVDLILGQDLGLASRGGLLANEAYMNQYIDHQIFTDQKGNNVVCSRQNQIQGQAHPYVQQGTLTGNQGYSTDGFQFFGTTYRQTNKPAILEARQLENHNYQYEFTYIALQSEPIELTAGTDSLAVFYGHYQADHGAAISQLEYRELIEAAYGDLAPTEKWQAMPVTVRQNYLGEVLTTEALTMEELATYYPKRFQEELDGKELLSFFTETHEHVVMAAKEIQVERSHGQIILSGKEVTIDHPIMASTSYMPGVFNAQITLGNTSMNKITSNVRNPLNKLKTSGQRILVKGPTATSYQLLGLPSSYEIGFNYLRWIYKTATETFIITNYTTVEENRLILECRALSGQEYEFLVTNQITLDEHEYGAGYRLTEEKNRYVFKPNEGSIITSRHPDFTFEIRVMDAESRSMPEDFLVTNLAQNVNSLFILGIEKTARFRLEMGASQSGTIERKAHYKLATEIEKYRHHLSDLMNGFKLAEFGPQAERLEKLNQTVWWYTHNMLVHYLSPHGLEQYSGAAWGTRDVCQGPFEYFMVMQKYDVVKRILLDIFSHQHLDGSWPQWFMFDEYHQIQADESHGDVIVWPLKALSDYLLVTNDTSILAEEIPFMDQKSGNYTLTKESLLTHLKAELEYIKTHFLPGTYLSAYGNGDWDDTLQPHNQELKENMASTWTVALTYQSMSQMAEGLAVVEGELAAELKDLSEKIKGDFEKYMLNDEVLPGFIYKNGDEVDYMIHPKDTLTGATYRLLPMTRSMIAELFTPAEMEKHLEVIEKELLYPDGVRLMDKPARYEGGVSKIFQRAEQAANFGREIGLQYVHAHIRYIEAMAKIGHDQQAWWALQAINPINITKEVPNAVRRQSNSYFSSSDGQFSDRYEAAENFSKLKTGEAKVKGGWRIYSSGSGIYLNQLISNVLGIRLEGQDLLLDPVLIAELDGLALDFKYLSYKVTFVYEMTSEAENQIIVNGVKVKSSARGNQYRTGLTTVKREDLEALLKVEGENIITIRLTK